MSTPENDPLGQNPGEYAQDGSLSGEPLEGSGRNYIDSNPAVAPFWHTVILVAGILLLSLGGATELSGAHTQVNRLQTYAFTAATEAGMLGWIYFGLRLRKVRFTSLLGSMGGGRRSLGADLGVAMVFWCVSLMILGSLGAFWTIVEAAIKHHSMLPSGNPLGPDPTQERTLHTLSQLAPSNGVEIAAWVLVCITAGFVEETIFRGYLQRQFTAWSRGSVAAGVALSSLLFGAAHGYQGVRNMVLLAVFGMLFSLLALYRGSLRAGIFAHAWHDLFAGLVLAFLKAHRML